MARESSALIRARSMWDFELNTRKRSGGEERGREGKGGEREGREEKRRDKKRGTKRKGKGEGRGIRILRECEGMREIDRKRKSEGERI